MRGKVLVVLILAAGLSGCAPSRPALRSGPPPPHHTRSGFRNLYQTPARKGLGAFLRWRLGLGPVENPPIPLELVPPYKPEIVRPDLDLIHRQGPDEIRITWIGHSSFLIQVAGLNLLVDPVFSDRVSPVSFLGPKRLAPPGIRFENLPRIDAVLISHNHYDHLDMATIKRLGNQPRYFVPLGGGARLGGLGIDAISELDWGETSSLGEVLVHCVPTQHFSGRGLFSFNRELWAGWVIEAGSVKILFAGDSGYAPHFKDIARRLGPIEVALLPIGAYRPRWFMRPMHMDPAEAVRAFQDLGAVRAVASHWGTFKQADEPMAEPPLYLRKALSDAGLRTEDFTALRFGETLVLNRGDLRDGRPSPQR